MKRLYALLALSLLVAYTLSFLPGARAFDSPLTTPGGGPVPGHLDRLAPTPSPFESPLTTPEKVRPAPPRPAPPTEEAQRSAGEDTPAPGVHRLCFRVVSGYELCYEWKD
jgi:hypothetical protein